MPTSSLNWSPALGTAIRLGQSGITSTIRTQGTVPIAFFQQAGACARIEVTFVLGWDGQHDNKLVEQAIDMACNRYCPIHATLSRGTTIEHHRRDIH